MNMLTNILMNVGLSIAACGIWAFLGIFLYRKEKISRRNVAYFQLFAGLDRLKDCLNEIHDLMNKSSSHKNNFYGLVKQNEKNLERYATSISYDRVVANIPYKSKKGEIIWMYDLDYILSNCQEMVNELFSLSTAVKEKGLGKDANIHIESLSNVAKDVLSAVEQEIKLIPDKNKNLDMNKN
jgi:hypothetical protein